jgi:hypothetical protein
LSTFGPTLTGSKCQKQSRKSQAIPKRRSGNPAWVNIAALTFTNKLLLDKAVDLLVGHPKSQTDRTPRTRTVTTSRAGLRPVRWRSYRLEQAKAS